MQPNLGGDVKAKIFFTLIDGTTIIEGCLNRWQQPAEGSVTRANILVSSNGRFEGPFDIQSDFRYCARCHYATFEKSAAENALIRAGADPADLGGYAICDAVKVGTGEMDMAMDDRDAMELEIANRFLDAEYRDIGSGSCLA